MYLRIQFAVIALLLLCVAGFNYIVDPYGIFLPDSSFKFSKNKTEFFSKEPIIKPFRVSDVKPDTLILGLSAAGVGYDENHPYYSDKSLYNFSMAGVSMYMVYRAFQHALLESRPKELILDLSMMSFNDHHTFVVRNENDVISSIFEGLIAANDDGSRNWFAKFNKATHIPLLLLSSQITRESLATLEKQKTYNWNLTSRGGWGGSTLGPGQSQGKRVLTVARYLVNGLFYNSSPDHQFSIYRKDGTLSRAFDYYERLLDDAYRNNIKVTLIISPTHMYFFEALDYLGFGDMFMEWKRNLVKINEEVARRNGREPFPVWDFSYYSELTTEPVPAVGNTSARMKWFHDPLHFTKVAGAHVLDQVYLGSDGTGMALTTGNFDAVMATQQQNKERFQGENPEVIERLNVVFKSASVKTTAEARQAPKERARSQAASTVKRNLSTN